MKCLNLVCICLVLCTQSVLAKNFGRVGTIFPIGEVDMLAWIDSRLRGFEQSGKLNEMEQAFKERVATSVERPAPVPGLTTTTEPTTYYVDPSLTTARDITDSNGKVIVSKGTRINPFDPSTWPHSKGQPDLPQFELGKTLVFLDGDDVQQRAWAKAFTTTKPVKWILVNGSPNELAELLVSKIYFDQQGNLSRKLHLQHIPAVVNQAGTQWEIKEIDVSLYPKQNNEGIR